MVSAAAFLETVWHGQRGLAEVVAEYFNEREHYEPPQAITRADRYGYFAPLLRTSKASTKTAVAPLGNVLWVDIDSRDAPAQIDNKLVQRGVVPSFIVDSGNKGYWAYLKLDRLVAKQEIEQLNRALAQLIPGGDRGAWNCDRLARIPGSTHNESGHIVTVVEATGIIHDPRTLQWLRDEAEAQELERDQEPEHLETAGAPFPLPKLSPEHWKYIDDRPRHREGYDRSAVEQSIFTALVLQGFTDEEIVAFADHSQLPRHRQERARHGDLRWTNRSLRNARAYLESQDVIPRSTPMCTESFTNHHLDRDLVLGYVDGRRTGEIVASVVAETRHSARTVLNALNQLQAAGDIERRHEGRSVFVSRTPRGDERVKSPFRLMRKRTPIRALRKC